MKERRQNKKHYKTEEKKDRPNRKRGRYNERTGAVQQQREWKKETTQTKTLQDRTTERDRMKGKERNELRKIGPGKIKEEGRE